MAYAPTTDLRGEGLGRHLANMLRGAEMHGNARFVLACPSWLLPELRRLFADEGVSPETYEVITTRGMPLSLRFYFLLRWLARFGSRSQIRSKDGWMARCGSRINQAREWVLEHFLATRNLVSFLLLLPFVLTSLLMSKALIAIARGVRNAASRIKKRVLERLPNFASRPQSIGLVFRLYRYLEVKEANLLVRLINSRRDVDVWYSPTSFWPEFNGIHGPKLMCVPDVVLSNFPVGYALVGGDRVMHAFTRVEAAIRGADNYVTYSEDVKWNTLVRGYGVDPERVFVVPHGNNSLAEFLAMESSEASISMDESCRAHLMQAMRKSSEPEYALDFKNMQFRYIFYASQFRPNKNVLTLLRAYEWLLRHRYVGVKLILTGNPEAMPEIRSFIKERELTKDVLCLRGLSTRELAACYRLAILAVNPSLSEGGFPFTFDEALSVGTPVVMSRIGVTEEIITDHELQADMLFDPYDWQDMARKIEWALENRDQLYQKQKPIYEIRSQRSWTHVVDDYVSLLDRISCQPNGSAIQL
ncbi:glycosyltransferase [Tepidiphilus succinatimandens]|uniref:glycosyltransferase n=1 Tax=Tepidiphilus succinatimandens TaxID=224436 RepID=UPI00147692C7|nr:glycosyltransferase [Tepidiphilus succinatimandens]